jgi:hypothetical protein
MSPTRRSSRDLASVRIGSSDGRKLLSTTSRNPGTTTRTLPSVGPSSRSREVRPRVTKNRSPRRATDPNAGNCVRSVTIRGSFRENPSRIRPSGNSRNTYPHGLDPPFILSKRPASSIRTPRSALLSEPSSITHFAWPPALGSRTTTAIWKPRTEDVNTSGRNAMNRGDHVARSASRNEAALRESRSRAGSTAINRPRGLGRTRNRSWWCCRTEDPLRLEVPCINTEPVTSASEANSATSCSSPATVTDHASGRTPSRSGAAS